MGLRNQKQQGLDLFPMKPWVFQHVLSMVYPHRGFLASKCRVVLSNRWSSSFDGLFAVLAYKQCFELSISFAAKIVMVHILTLCIKDFVYIKHFYGN